MEENKGDWLGGNREKKGKGGEIALKDGERGVGLRQRKTKVAEIGMGGRQKRKEEVIGLVGGREEKEREIGLRDKEKKERVRE